MPVAPAGRMASDERVFCFSSYPTQIEGIDRDAQIAKMNMIPKPVERSNAPGRAGATDVPTMNSVNMAHTKMRVFGFDGQ